MWWPIRVKDQTPPIGSTTVMGGDRASQPHKDGITHPNDTPAAKLLNLDELTLV